MRTSTATLRPRAPPARARGRAPSPAVSLDQLREPTLLALGRRVLVQEREVVLLERLEPLVPGDLLERVLAAPAGEVDAEDARVVVAPRRLHARRMPAALLDPAPDLVVICRDVALCHGRAVPASRRRETGRPLLVEEAEV